VAVKPLTTLPGPVPRSARRPYIDWARGLAVLIMFEAHTLDAWTRLSERTTSAFSNLTMLGGFAAPLFLWLAGVALVLSAERQLVRTGSRRTAMAAIVRRGLEIFILAFLFRIQAFIVSPGSWPITIFRVDILNIMGPAIAAAGLAWGLSGNRNVAALVCGSLATLVAMVTPIVRTAGWVDLLPLWIQWQIRPFGDHTTFTLFPWAGFVFAGAACGTLLARAADRRREVPLVAGIAVAGAALLALGFYTASLPTIYQASSYWTSSPTYFAVRVGTMMLALGVLFAAHPLASWFTRSARFLETLGRNSLFVYWIHVEIAYGYLTWPLRHHLPLWGFALAFPVFCAAMYGAVIGRDKLVGSWRGRATAQPSPTIATA
jgi:uncharacterized membrane protein